MNPVLCKSNVELYLSDEDFGIPQETGAAHYIEQFICLGAA